MILTLKELAENLKTSERTIQRMIKSGQIKAEKLGGQYRFKGSSIDSIFFQNNGSDSENFVPMSEFIHTTFEIPVSRLISANNIILDMKATNMREAIQELTPASVFNNLVLDINDLREKCISRENLLNTGIGQSIAIPHPRDPLTSLRTSGCVMIGRAVNGIDYTLYEEKLTEDKKGYEPALDKDGNKIVINTTADEKPVKLFFLICAQTIELHLHIMGKVATLVKNEDFINACMTAKSSEDVLRAILVQERAAILNK